VPARLRAAADAPPTFNKSRRFQNEFSLCIILRDPSITHMQTPIVMHVQMKQGAFRCEGGRWYPGMGPEVETATVDSPMRLSNMSYSHSEGSVIRNGLLVSWGFQFGQQNVVEKRTDVRFTRLSQVFSSFEVLR
jgi:hypothetical protein